MRRRLFNFASAVSAVLFVGVCLLWVRSHSRFDGVYWLRRWTGVSPLKHFDCFDSAQAETKPGMVIVSWGNSFFPFGHPHGHGSVYWESHGFKRVWGTRYGWTFLGAGFHRFDSGLVAVTVPFWLPALAALPAPGIWLFRRISARRRRRAGLCPTCGYDLRATADRCPECGERVLTPRPEPGQVGPPVTVINGGGGSSGLRRSGTLDYYGPGSSPTGTAVLFRAAAVAFALLIGIIGLASVLLVGDWVYSVARGAEVGNVRHDAPVVTVVGGCGVGLIALSLRAFRRLVRRRRRRGTPV